MAHSDLTERARTLRTGHTNAEGLVWHSMRNRKLGGWKWKRQVPRGPYIVDFLCAEANLIVEVDGWTHNADREIAYDERRTAYLESLGLRVLRITNRGVYQGLNGICDAILAACGGEKEFSRSPRSGSASSGAPSAGPSGR